MSALSRLLCAFGWHVEGEPYKGQIDAEGRPWAFYATCSRCHRLVAISPRPLREAMPA